MIDRNTRQKSFFWLIRCMWIARIGDGLLHRLSLPITIPHTVEGWMEYWMRLKKKKQKEMNPPTNQSTIIIMMILWWIQILLPQYLTPIPLLPPLLLLRRLIRGCQEGRPCEEPLKKRQRVEKEGNGKKQQQEGQKNSWSLKRPKNNKG